VAAQGRHDRHLFCLNFPCLLFCPTQAIAAKNAFKKIFGRLFMFGYPCCVILRHWRVGVREKDRCMILFAYFTGKHICVMDMSRLLLLQRKEHAAGLLLTLLRDLARLIYYLASLWAFTHMA
jgi:hypothetical protein